MKYLLYWYIGVPVLLFIVLPFIIFVGPYIVILIKWIFKGLFWIISLPFRGIWSLIKLIFTGSSKAKKVSPKKSRTHSVSNSIDLQENLNKFNEYDVRKALDRWSNANPLSYNFLGSHMSIDSLEYDTAYINVIHREDIVRTTKWKESPGQGYTHKRGSTNPYDYEYERPHFRNNKQYENNESKVMLPSVKTYDCPKTVECFACHGTGICDECHGSGSLVCRECHGSGIIYDSEHNRKRCWNCDGTGRIICSSCNGSGVCTFCDGTGVQECSRCRGTGYYQQYESFKSKYFADNDIIINSINDDRTLIELLTKNRVIGEIIFDDILYKKSSESRIKIDNKSKFWSLINESTIKNSFTKIENKYNTSHSGRKDYLRKLISYRVPVIRIVFSLSGKRKYKGYLLGHNVKSDNGVFMLSYPKKSLLSALSNFFTKIKRKKIELAMIRIASYLAWSDGTINSEEEDLLEHFINETSFSPDRRRELHNKLINQRTTFENIYNDVLKLKSKPFLITFAWHLIMIDGRCTKEEEEAFNKIVEASKFSGKQIEQLKKKLENYKRINKRDLLRAYIYN